MYGSQPPPAYQPPAAPSYAQLYPSGNEAQQRYGGQFAYGTQFGYGFAPPPPPAVNNQSLQINVVQPRAQPIVINQPVTVFTPPSYLGWSIFNFLCCFWPLGLAALIFSCKVGGSATEEEARRNSRTARSLNVAATVLGPALAAIIAGCVVGAAAVATVSANNNAYNYYNDDYSYYYYAPSYYNYYNYYSGYYYYYSG